MPALETTALASLVAKLITAAFDTATAAKTDGWGAEDGKALAGHLETIPLFKAAFQRENGVGAPLQSYCELVSLAFGAAWRAHWAGSELAAPEAPRSKFARLWMSAEKKQRLRQVEQALKAGAFDAALLGGAEVNVIGLLDSLEEPRNSHWYRALWAAFLAAEEVAEDGAAESPPCPLLMLTDGADRSRFEQDFLYAFHETLASSGFQSLRAWLRQKHPQRAPLVRRLLAGAIWRIRDEPLFGATGDDPTVPRMPLHAVYVEPDACRRTVRGESGPGGDRFGERTPVLRLLESQLADPATRIMLVMADFGRGKSLTARTLAWRMAQRFLTTIETPTVELQYPVFAVCLEAFRSDLDVGRAIGRAQKRVADGVWLGATAQEPELKIHAAQSTVVFFDGLDEVRIAENDTRELFEELRDRAHEKCKFVVFSRPAAIGDDVLAMKDVALFELQDFSSVEDDDQNGTSHVAQWLEKWSMFARSAWPTERELVEHGLINLCAVPVLLYMVAETWAQVRSKAGLGRVDIYEEFVSLTSRSKLKADMAGHPVVAEAADALCGRLLHDGWVVRGAAKEQVRVHAMMELLSRIAWEAHKLEEQRKPLVGLDIKMLLRDLGLEPRLFELVERGVLLTLRSSLGDGAPELYFTHKSFREFLVARLHPHGTMRFARSWDQGWRDDRGRACPL